jgi:REP element-mobilizing transposase RayT
VSHRKRPTFSWRHPLIATVKLAKGLPSLREKQAYDLLRKVFAAACERFGFRLVHFSIQRDHLHFLVEAADATALTRGMQGLAIRVAKALNKLWGRKGKVFGDRYHARPLKTPREVRHALAYVLNNAWKHRASARTTPTHTRRGGGSMAGSSISRPAMCRTDRLRRQPPGS